MLRASPRRWTAAERDRRLADSSPFKFASPTAEQLSELARCYEAITGIPILRQKKLNLLATCYRVHGDDTLRFIQDEFAKIGTDNNLLGIVRASWPRAHSQVDLNTSSRPDDPEALHRDSKVDVSVVKTSTVRDAATSAVLLPVTTNPPSQPAYSAVGDTVHCLEYDAHRHLHRWVDDRFQCDSCVAPPGTRLHAANTRGEAQVP